MDNTEYYIEHLFRAAKEQTPKRSLENVKSAFDTSISSGHEPTLTKSSQIFTNTNIIMGTGILLIAMALFTLNADQEVNYSERMDTVESLEFPMEVGIHSQQIGKSSQIHPFTEPSIPKKGEEHDSKDNTSLRTVPKKTRPSKKVITESTVPNSQHRNPVYAGIGEEEPTQEMLFLINNNTTREELDDIKKKAEEAGIEFDYKAKGNIKRLRITMKLRTDESQSTSSISLDGKFEFEIGWIADDSGNAIEFWNDLDDNETPELFQTGEEGKGLFEHK